MHQKTMMIQFIKKEIIKLLLLFSKGEASSLSLSLSLSAMSEFTHIQQGQSSYDKSPTHSYVSIYHFADVCGLAVVELLLLIPYEDGELGCTNLCEHFIDVGDAQPIRQRCYPVSPAVEKEMHKEVDALLKKGVIKPSKSEWASPVVMVRREVVDENHKPITK